MAGPTYNFSYTYDLAGDLTSETYPSGRVLNTTFDVATRPATITSQGASTAYVQQAGYWPSGAGYYWQYGNTVWPVEGYSAQLTPWYTSATLNNNGNYYLLALGTTWNANNTVQQTAEGFGPPGGYYGLTFLYQNYNYDRLNRLQAVIDTNYSRGFNYDEFGNMSLSEYGTVMPSTLAPLSGGGRANPYDPGTNRLLGTTFGYDTRGDLTTLGAMTITYDAEASQTRTVDSGTGQTISYTFDAEGQRVEKQISGGATIIDVHDAFGNLAAEYNSAGVTPACTTCYLVYDGVGSVRLVTDQSGNIVARHDYLPFGDEIANGVAGRIGNFGFTTNITQGFTGQEYDGGTGWLDYFNARHLSVAIGSFTQPDPMQAGADFLNPQSWNGYGYVGGQPLVYTDPSGMNWFSGIGATIGSIFSSLFGSGNDGCDPGVDFCGGTVQSGGVETTGSYGGGGLLFPSGGGSSGGGAGGGGGGSTYDNGDVFRATSFISNPAKTRPASCAGKSSADLNYNVPNSLGETGRQHIERLHMALLSRKLIPNMKSQYLFTPPSSASDNWRLVVAINAYIFDNPSNISQNSPKSNIVFTGAVPPEALLPGYPGYLVLGDRFEIGLKRVGNALGLPKFAGTNVGTLVTQSDCSSVRSGYPGEP